MPSPVQIRLASAGEFRRIAEVHVLARYDMTYLPHVHSFAAIEGWIRDTVLPSRGTWIAETDGAVIAYAWLHEGFLRALYVHPSHQRRGIGGTLLSEIKKIAADGFQLWMFEANEGAIRFYERHGAKLVRKTDGGDNEEKLPDRLMRFG